MLFTPANAGIQRLQHLAKTRDPTQSSAVTLASGATLALNGFSQTLNNLSGAGSLCLASASLTANDTGNTSFSGTVSGAGSVIKSGAGILTLSGANTYGGGTTISGGTLAVTNGSALGTGTVINHATLDLAFTADGSVANTLAGNGLVQKSGTTTTSLTGAGSDVGSVDVAAGPLDLNQSGAFTADSYTTGAGATTQFGPASQLVVTNNFTQAAGATLDVLFGANPPVVSAATADLDGTLSVVGFATAILDTASALTSTTYTVVHTIGGISGSFGTVDLNGAVSTVDYLTLAGRIVGNDYMADLDLTWLAGATKGNGVFTLAAPADTFTVDVPLAGRAASATGWDGSTLTKNGAGTLILDHANSYTRTTTVNGGTLSLQQNGSLGDTAELVVGDTGVVVLNGTTETIGKLTTISGSSVNLQGGTLDISGAQRAAGDPSGGTVQANTLAGKGDLLIDPSILIVYGANPSYTGDVTVTGGSQLIMNNAAGVGNVGLINLSSDRSDLLTFDTLLGETPIGTLEKSLAGLGTVQTRDGADITLAGINSAFYGLFDVPKRTRCLNAPPTVPCPIRVDCLCPSCRANDEQCLVVPRMACNSCRFERESGDEDSTQRTTHASKCRGSTSYDGVCLRLLPGLRCLRSGARLTSFWCTDHPSADTGEAGADARPDHAFRHAACHHAGRRAR